MKKVLMVLLIVSGSFLAGCGQQGALYFPNDEPVTEAEQQTETDVGIEEQ